MATFRYLGIPLDQTDDDEPAVRLNIMNTRAVWGALLQRDGAEPRVLAIFYRAVVQAIILYGLETWVLSAEMERKVEGIHTEFLWQITGKRVRRLRDGEWETPVSEVVREAAVMQSERNYIGRQQANVDQWVAVRPIFGVFAREAGYEGVGSIREAWWRQEASEKQLRATLEDLREAKRRRSGGYNATL